MKSKTHHLITCRNNTKPKVKVKVKSPLKGPTRDGTDTSAWDYSRTRKLSRIATYPAWLLDASVSGQAKNERSTWDITLLVQGAALQGWLTRPKTNTLKLIGTNRASYILKNVRPKSQSHSPRFSTPFCWRQGASIPPNPAHYRIV